MLEVVSVREVIGSISELFLREELLFRLGKWKRARKGSKSSLSFRFLALFQFPPFQIQFEKLI